MNTARIYAGTEFDRNCSRLSDTEKQRGLDILRAALLDCFGGLTETRGSGQWLDEAGRVHVEQCAIFDVIGTDITAPGLSAILNRVNCHLNQSQYLVTIDGRSEFIRPYIQAIQLEG